MHACPCDIAKCKIQHCGTHLKWITSSVTPKAPLIQAFGKSDSCSETQRVVSVKMQDAEAVARMAATPGGRKALQRARRRSRLPFETVGSKNQSAFAFPPTVVDCEWTDTWAC